MQDAATYGPLCSFAINCREPAYAGDLYSVLTTENLADNNILPITASYYFPLEYFLMSPVRT